MCSFFFKECFCWKREEGVERGNFGIKKKVVLCEKCILLFFAFVRKCVCVCVVFFSPNGVPRGEAIVFHNVPSEAPQESGN